MYGDFVWWQGVVEDRNDPLKLGRCRVRILGYHTDNKESHIAAIYALNTCDGYTKFKDGTKVDSIANRLYFFEGGIDHASTTTTNVPARFNINFNFHHSVESLYKLMEKNE